MAGVAFPTLLYAGSHRTLAQLCFCRVIDAATKSVCSTVTSKLWRCLSFAALLWALSPRPPPAPGLPKPTIEASMRTERRDDGEGSAGAAVGWSAWPPGGA